MRWAVAVASFMLVGCTGVELRESPRDSYVAELVSILAARRDRAQWIADRIQRRCYPTNFRQATVAQIGECAATIGLVCEGAARISCGYQAETRSRPFKFFALPALAFDHGDWRIVRTNVRLHGEESGPWELAVDTEVLDPGLSDEPND